MRRDHFVPVGYLKNFTDRDGKLHQVTKKYWHHSYVYPEQTCWKDHGNEVPKEFLETFELSDPMVIERQAFKQYEDKVKHLSELFLAHEPLLSNSLFTTLCNGYILQKQRTPYYQNGIAEIAIKRGEEFLENVMRELREEREIEFNGHPYAHLMDDQYWDNIKQMLREKRHDAHTTQIYGVLTTAMGKNIETMKMLRRLLRMELTILNAADGEFFFTSDNPGFSIVIDPAEPTVIVNANTGFPYTVGVGLPINSKQVIHIHNGKTILSEFADRQVRYLNLSSADTKSFNEGTINYSNEKIICIDKEYLMKFKPT